MVESRAMLRQPTHGSAQPMRKVSAMRTGNSRRLQLPLTAARRARALNHVRR